MPSINNVSSKGEGGEGQKCQNLLSKKTTKGEGGREGLIKSEKRARVVYGWPLSKFMNLHKVTTYMSALLWFWSLNFGYKY